MQHRRNLQLALLYEASAIAPPTCMSVQMGRYPEWEPVVQAVTQTQSIVRNVTTAITVAKRGMAYATLATTITKYPVYICSDRHVAHGAVCSEINIVFVIARLNWFIC